MNHRFAVLLTAATLCAGLNHAANAQAAPKLFPDLFPEYQVKENVGTIRVKNVAPSVIAWWIDPQNHQVPEPFRNSLRSQGATEFAVPNSMKKGVQATDTIGKITQSAPAKENVSVLPAGVDKIIALDPQNTLRVFGTKAGFQKIKELASVLDKPLRQIEIEAQFVQIKPEDMAEFGISFVKPEGDFVKPKNREELLQPGFMSGNYQATLSTLMAQNRAKVITAPRAIAINSLQANLTWQDTQFNSSSPKEGAGRLQITTVKFVFSVTPTINIDDTVTLVMSTSSTLDTSGLGTGESSSEEMNKGMEAIANVRDGETIALAGLSSHYFTSVKHSPDKTAHNVIVFVTTRIVRRADEGL